jgi:hypothetical protein
MMSLPDDPEEAFVRFEQLAREHLDEALELEASTNGSGWHNELEYMSEVIGAAKAYGIDEVRDWRLPHAGDDDLGTTYRNFRLQMNYHCVQLRVRHAQRTRRHSVAFDPAAKVKLRHLLNQMREMVDNEKQLTPRKKDALYARIADLSKEIDSDWSRLESYGAMAVEVADDAGEVAGKLESLRKIVDSIAAVFGKAKRDQDEQARLPAPREQKRIEAPKESRSTPPKVRDDEIPY